MTMSEVQPGAESPKAPNDVVELAALASSSTSALVFSTATTPNDLVSTVAGIFS